MRYAKVTITGTVLVQYTSMYDILTIETRTVSYIYNVMLLALVQYTRTSSYRSMTTRTRTGTYIPVRTVRLTLTCSVRVPVLLALSNKLYEQFHIRTGTSTGKLPVLVVY